MKYLVISRPVHHKTAVSRHPKNLKSLQAKLEKAKAKGVIEACYSLVGGGHVYVCEAKDTEALNKIVRYNPWYDSSTVEVHPVVESSSWLQSFADHIEQHHMKKS